MDGAGCNAITGWAWDSTQPDTPINVNLYAGASPIATVPANIFRSDLLAAGVGNGYHGFSLPVPSYLKDGALHYIWAYADIGGAQVMLNYSGHWDVNCSANSTGYQYYYTDPLTSVNSSNWVQNGSVTATSTGLTATTSGGGSLISSIAVPDGTSDYEVKTTLTLATSGGTYVSYLRASPDAKTGPGATGTFYSLEYTPTFS